jgi:FkbM family methyltransferase
MRAKVTGWRGILRSVYYWGRYFRHRLAPRQTYAADSEDVAAGLLLGKVTRFIDVGANDGITLSNTALFALQGARGLCFEPNAGDFLRLRELYRWNHGVECVEEGLSDEGGTRQFRSDGLLSALPGHEDPGLAKLLAGFSQADAPLIMIRVDKLSTWLHRRPDFQDSDVLSIDVEGHELHVLRGIDWERHPKPARCLILETHADGANGSWRHRDYEAIDGLLAGQGYVRVATNSNNTFWLHRADLDEACLAAARRRLPAFTWFVGEKTAP